MFLVFLIYGSFDPDGFGRMSYARTVTDKGLRNNQILAETSQWATVTSAENPNFKLIELLKNEGLRSNERDLSLPALNGLLVNKGFRK